jgi:integrase/recombinase XerD
MDLCELQELFVKERRYLNNVSPNTLEWYKYSFRAFAPHLRNCPPEGLRPALKAAVMALRESKLQPSSLNDYIRALNAFLHWAEAEGHLPELIRLDYLKAEQKLIATLNAEQIKRIVDWKPVRFCGKRLHAVCCLLLDIGLRFEEALTLRREDVDLDNLLMRIRGKGGKHRVVPISHELRKVLWKFQRQHEFPLLFCTRQGNALEQRNVLREFKALAASLSITGVRFSAHTMRHTFAVNYLRAGGNVLYLQRILGHSNLEMTNRYVQSLGVDDLKAVHDRFSLLTR